MERMHNAIKVCFPGGSGDDRSVREEMGQLVVAAKVFA